MIEQYFEKYDRAILPRAYNHPSFSKKLENSNFQTEIPKEKKHSSFQKSKEKNISDLSSMLTSVIIESHGIYSSLREAVA